MSIEMLAMSFNYYQEIDLNSARSLIIYSVNEYLSDINNNKEIKPYLSNYPFTSKNIETRIFIYGPDRRKLPPEKIGYISSRDGILRYYTRSDDDHPICTETYDEALGKIAFCQEEARGQNTNEKVIVNEAMAKDGAKAQVIAVSLEHSIYELAGEGFKPNESLNCISTSCDEVLYFQVKANEDGKLIGVGSMPAVIGESGGICRIDILREDAPLHLKYPWGSEALQATSKVGNEETIIEVAAQDGASAHIYAADFDNSVFHLGGRGFHPHEPLNLISSSFHDIAHRQINADENGNFPTLEILPGVSGKPGGTCYIDILREKDTIHMQFAWGSEALR